MKIDWSKVEFDFIYNNLSRDELCKKYNIKYKTLDSRIHFYKWNEKIRENQEKARKKTESIFQDELANRQIKVKNHREINGYKDIESLDKAISKIQIEIDMGTLDNANLLSTMINTKQKVYDGIFKSLGLDKPEIEEKELNKIINLIMDKINEQLDTKTD